MYYYCDYADPKTLHIERIMGTLLKQLLPNGQIPDDIQAKIPLHFGENQETLGGTELIDLVSLGLRLGSPVFVIIDGLDECEKETKQMMIGFLKRITHSSSMIVKCLILCREEDQLLRSFQATLSISVTSMALEGDIKSFVIGSVKSRIASGDLRLRKPELEQEIVSELVTKAHGMFLWVYFQIDELCEAPSDALIRETLRNLPDGLVGTYQRIFCKIEKNLMRSLIARKLITWIACAQRPMTIEEAREAVAFEPSDASWDAEKIPDKDLMIEW